MQNTNIVMSKADYLARYIDQGIQKDISMPSLSVISCIHDVN